MKCWFWSVTAALSSMFAQLQLGYDYKMLTMRWGMSSSLISASGLRGSRTLSCRSHSLFSVFWRSRRLQEQQNWYSNTVDWYSNTVDWYSNTTVLSAKIQCCDALSCTVLQSACVYVCVHVCTHVRACMCVWGHNCVQASKGACQTPSAGLRHPSSSHCRNWLRLRSPETVT